MDLSRKHEETAERIRQRLPEAVKTVTQLVVDNPGQVAVTVAGSMVLTRVLANAMRPRTAIEALALLIVCEVGGIWLAAKAMDAGILRFRVRDAGGRLVPFDPFAPGRAGGDA